MIDQSYEFIHGFYLLVFVVVVYVLKKIDDAYFDKYMAAQYDIDRKVKERPISSYRAESLTWCDGESGVKHVEIDIGRIPSSSEYAEARQPEGIRVDGTLPIYEPIKNGVTLEGSNEQT